MSEETAKEIIITLIEKGVVCTGKDNVETAERIAELYNTLLEKTKDTSHDFVCQVD